MRGTIRSTLCLLGLGALVLSGCAHKQLAKRSGLDDGALAGNGSNGNDSESSPCAVRVHFDYDSTEIPERDRPGLASSAGCLKDDRALKVTVEGNADERGTEEYNIALGDRRARAVEKYLQDLGAEHGQTKTVSFGEENPVCADHHESCWSLNRRAAVKPHGAAIPDSSSGSKEK